VRIEWRTIFVAFVAYYTSSKNDPCPLRNSLLQFPIKGNKESFITAKAECDNAFAHFGLSQFVCIPGHSYFLETEIVVNGLGAG
jgi:hypothetical protein